MPSAESNLISWALNVRRSSAPNTSSLPDSMHRHTCWAVKNRLGDADEDFDATSEDHYQLWQVKLEDSSGRVPFDEVELTFAYDESLLGVPSQNADEMEPRLQVYHWDAGDEQWKAQPVVARDTNANTITILADSFSAFVLGYGEPEEPANEFANFELALDQAHFPDGSIETFGYLDVELLDDSRWTNDMQIHLQRPGGTFQPQPTGWSSVALDFEIADGQSLTDFIASLPRRLRRWRGLRRRDRWQQRL